MSSFLLPNGVGGPVFRLAMVDPDGGSLRHPRHVADARGGAPQSSREVTGDTG